MPCSLFTMYLHYSNLKYFKEPSKLYFHCSQMLELWRLWWLVRFQCQGCNKIDTWALTSPAKLVWFLNKYQRYVCKIWNLKYKVKIPDRFNTILCSTICIQLLCLILCWCITRNWLKTIVSCSNTILLGRRCIGLSLTGYIKKVNLKKK